MKKLAEYDTKILQSFVVALAYGDTSSLNEEEEQQLDDWCTSYSEQHTNGSLTFDYGQDTDFGKCEICSLSGDVIECKITVFQK